ncbi:MAG: LamG domain-containing protein [Kiritimatiellae bacterium]|nr:LamG domain-containing protein [Kiritimatiellia bacterium]
MRCLACAGVTLLLLTLVSCSSSTGPDGIEESTYPEISGLVVYYEFDGDLENEVSDSHDGTANRELAYVADRHGSASAALYVNTSDEVVVPDHPDLDITGGITLAAWVRPEASDRAYAAVIDKKYSEAYSFGMYGGIADPDTVGLTSYIGSGGDWSPDIVPMGTGTWSHIAYTFEDSTGKGRFYLNGSVADSSTRAVTLAVTDEDLRIGGAYLSDDYKGSIDQVAVFNRALTPVEIGQLFAFN